MKKLPFLFAFLIVMSALAACSPKKEPTPQDVIPSDQTPVETGALETEEDTENTGDATFEAAKKELELINE